MIIMIIIHPMFCCVTCAFFLPFVINIIITIIIYLFIFSYLFIVIVIIIIIIFIWLILLLLLCFIIIIVVIMLIIISWCRDIIRWGRNASVSIPQRIILKHGKDKGRTIYKQATALECLLGTLLLMDNNNSNNDNNNDNENDQDNDNENEKRIEQLVTWMIENNN